LLLREHHVMRAELSERLKRAIESSGRRRWQLAREHHLHPSVLSSMLTGARDADMRDERVLRLAESLGVPRAEAFAGEHVGAGR
jgi:hypothetical protein